MVTKCPESLDQDKKKEFKSRISKYTKTGTPVFFTTYTYQKPVLIGSETDLQKNVVLLTGIANPEPLQQYLKEQGFTILEHYNFPDHYNYTIADLERIKAKTALFEKPFSFVTTQKDAVKLAGPGLEKLTEKLPFFYLPIEVAFLQDQEKFDEIIQKAAKKN